MSELNHLMGLTEQPVLGPGEESNKAIAREGESSERRTFLVVSRALESLLCLSAAARRAAAAAAAAVQPWFSGWM